jgi:hypothetical protein
MIRVMKPEDPSGLVCDECGDTACFFIDTSSNSLSLCDSCFSDLREAIMHENYTVEGE